MWSVGCIYLLILIAKQEDGVEDNTSEQFLDGIGLENKVISIQATYFHSIIFDYFKICQSLRQSLLLKSNKFVFLSTLYLSFWYLFPPLSYRYR